MLRRHERALSGVVDAYTRDVDRHVPIHPEYAASLLDELAADDAIVTVDTGMCNVWAARYITPNGRRRLLGSFKHGSMANALPHAIGAQFAAPGRQVIAMAGDGGLAMLLGELLTLRTHRLPVKVVVFNNSSLGMVKLEMLVEGYPEFETDHDPVDFAAIARAAGLFGRRVEKPGEVADGIREVLAHPGPALLDLVTDPNALSIPPHHHRRAGPRLRPGRDPHRAGGRRRTHARAGPVQPAQHPPPLTDGEPGRAGRQGLTGAADPS